MKDGNKSGFSIQHLLFGAALAEGITLVLLLFVAVPLKHLAGYPYVVTWIGPVHGLAFIFYIWMALHVAAAESWDKWRLFRVLTASLVPFGGFLTAWYLRQLDDGKA